MADRSRATATRHAGALASIAVMVLTAFMGGMPATHAQSPGPQATSCGNPVNPGGAPAAASASPRLNRVSASSGHTWSAAW